MGTLDILFRQITTFIKVCVAFVFGLQTLWLKDISKIYQLKGLKPKNNDHTNFYECCDLTKKVYLKRVLYLREVRGCHNNKAAFLHAKSPPGLETSTFTFDASASTTPSTSNSSWWWWWRRWLFKISFLASMASLDPWFGLIMTQHHGILINPLHLKKDSLF